MQLRQNVVLLRNGDEPDSFFPVCLPYKLASVGISVACVVASGS